jgi:hypothetical protein
MGYYWVKNWEGKASMGIKQLAIGYVIPTGIYLAIWGIHSPLESVVVLGVFTVLNLALPVGNS